MSERILASVEQIKAVLPHPNADRLSIYQVKGWQVIDQKDAYKVGDLVIYCEVDSWIPTALAPFLTKGKEPREFNGVKGERLRTIKLRGQLSQGLLLRLPGNFILGEDVSSALNIQKWEKPIPPQLAGQVRGSLPEFLRKTDQERIQNIPQQVLEELHSRQTVFQVTEKLDGSSMTVYNYNGEWGVTSRNIDLKLDQEDNIFVDMFLKLSPELDTLKDELVYLGIPNFAVQGELIGGNIQGNQYKIHGFDYYIFDIYNIDTQEYLNTPTVETLADILGINHVPVITINTLATTSITDLLLLAEGTSKLNNSEREGLVYKTLDRKFSFKTISNSWLLNND